MAADSWSVEITDKNRADAVVLMREGLAVLEGGFVEVTQAGRTANLRCEHAGVRRPD